LEFEQMTKGGITVIGMEEVQAKLDQVSGDLSGAEMITGMKDAALIVTRVGSNVKYAPFQELGTRPFWPPLSALETWAKRHGTSAFLVARAIATRGIKAVRYLQRALEDNADRIYQKVGATVSRIVER
jgi:hypothetical protein